MKYETGIIACARWEERYIVEWLSYYKYLGIGHVYLYCNDDSPRDLYNCVLPFTLGPNPFVTFLYFPYQGQQYEMYRHFLEHYRLECDWISFLDIDEFVRLEDGCTNISGFIEKYESIADSVLLNWIFFGPNGFKDAPPPSIIEGLDRRQNVIHPYTKHFTRVSALQVEKVFDREQANAFWHNPYLIANSECRVVNVLGHDMKSYYEQFPLGATAYVDDVANKDAIIAASIINHYAFRSESSFFDRFKRGLKGAFSGQGMWRNLAESPDFQGYIDASNAILDDRLSLTWKGATAVPKQSYVVPLPEGNLITADAFASQSSLSDMSVGQTLSEDASRALSKDFDDKSSFHTGYDIEPWWEVIFSHETRVSEVRVFNRLDYPKLQRDNSQLDILAYDDLGVEHVLYRSPPNDLIGGVDGRPLIIAGSHLLVRRVRVRSQKPGYLSLAHVEIYSF